MVFCESPSLSLLYLLPTDALLLTPVLGYLYLPPSMRVSSLGEQYEFGLPLHTWNTQCLISRCAVLKTKRSDRCIIRGATQNETLGKWGYPDDRINYRNTRSF